jgi:hypothetical protein
MMCITSEIKIFLDLCNQHTGYWLRIQVTLFDLLNYRSTSVISTTTLSVQNYFVIAEYSVLEVKNSLTRPIESPVSWEFQHKFSWSFCIATNYIAWKCGARDIIMTLPVAQDWFRGYIELCHMYDYHRQWYFCTWYPSYWPDSPRKK